MKKIVLVMVVAMLCSLNLSAGELEDNIKNMAAAMRRLV